MLALANVASAYHAWLSFIRLRPRPPTPYTARRHPCMLFQQGLSVRLEATHLHFKGVLRLALQLSESERPGIQGIHYSFDQEPELDFTIRPLGDSTLLQWLPGM